MFDKNYLGHYFLKYKYDKFGYDFKCETCGIIIWIEGNYSDSYYMINNKGYHTFLKVNLSCNDFIIKGIIE